MCYRVTHLMKGPLIYACILFAAILIALSFAIVIFPDSVETFQMAYGIFGIAAIITLILILVRMRNSQ